MLSVVFVASSFPQAWQLLIFPRWCWAEPRASCVCWTCRSCCHGQPFQTPNSIWLVSCLSVCLFVFVMFQNSVCFGFTPSVNGDKFPLSLLFFLVNLFVFRSPTTTNDWVKFWHVFPNWCTKSVTTLNTISYNLQYCLMVMLSSGPIHSLSVTAYPALKLLAAGGGVGHSWLFHVSSGRSCDFICYMPKLQVNENMIECRWSLGSTECFCGVVVLGSNRSFYHPVR